MRGRLVNALAVAAAGARLVERDQDFGNLHPSRPLWHSHAKTRSVGLANVAVRHARIAGEVFEGHGLAAERDFAAFIGPHDKAVVGSAPVEIVLAGIPFAVDQMHRGASEIPPLRIHHHIGQLIDVAIGHLRFPAASSSHHRRS